MQGLKTSSAAPASSADREAPGGARYQVLERLGSGGMGVVFRVFDRVAGGPRALKRARLEDEAQRRSASAFEREYQTLASLDHPRIIRVFDYGVDGQGPFYTMELLAGQDMKQAAPLPFTAACQCLRDVATSLALLHARCLIHRDLSPSNVRMTSDGRCKLLDFGALAPFGPSSVIVGTPPAIAPEALGGAPLDQRVDLYALGALAYWMLTGVHAYPARELRELRPLWDRPLQPPSTLVPEIPAELDTLVLSLLQLDALARPATASEVISRLEAIGELPPEPNAETQLLAQSFLRRPRFIGRTRELSLLAECSARARAGSGAAVCVRASAGTGRSRLLSEVGLSSALTGALVLRADANICRQLNGVARALVLRLFEAAPELCSTLGRAYRGVLLALGGGVAQCCTGSSSELTQPTAASAASLPAPGRLLESLLLEASEHKPLVLLVDDVEYADDASIGMLAAIASRCAQHRVLLVVSERCAPTHSVGLSLTALHGYCRELELTAFAHCETVALVHGLFGGAPNAARFSEWLHQCSAGAPAYAIEVCRQLLAQGGIQYAGGAWTLPVARPDVGLPAALGDAMSLRLSQLSEPARALAECLSLQQEPPDRELCRLLTDHADPSATLELLAELTRHDVLGVTDDGGYRFTSNALREALLAGMDEARRQRRHRRLGEVLATLAGDSDGDAALRMQAGWHLIRGDAGERGADMIARVAADGVAILTLVSNQHRAGAIVQEALSVYERLHRSPYRRAPLLAALAYAGYCEDRVWGERHGDQIVDVLEDLSGARAARRLRPWLGRWLGVIVAMLLAFVRFRLRPRKQRPYSFYRLYVQLCGAVTALTGIAALSLDAARAARLADTLEPFSIFPQWSTIVGAYQFCRSLEQVGLENQPLASEMFETLLERFRDRRYYPTLTQGAREMLVGSLHFARGACAVFKADGSLALQSADALDALGLKLSAMTASQLRYLYYVNRGEFAKAAPHHMQVELHAARFGSAWQVETWEAPALIVVHSYTLDTVEAARVVHRLEVLARTVPSLRRYERLARHALMLARGVPRFVERVAQEYAGLSPRSYIGWGATIGHVARAYNEIGSHAKAKHLCEQALAQLSDAHRDYVSLFLILDIELALADAGLGDSARALTRIDGLRARFSGCDNPLLQGSLYEARARICWATGDAAGFAESLDGVERHFRPTGTPILIVKCERLALLTRPRVSVNHQQDTPTPASRGRRISLADEVSEAETIIDPPIARKPT